jgi:hypothetical protein
MQHTTKRAWQGITDTRFRLSRSFREISGLRGAINAHQGRWHRQARGEACCAAVVGAFKGRHAMDVVAAPHSSLFSPNPGRYGCSFVQIQTLFQPSQRLSALSLPLRWSVVTLLVLVAFGLRCLLLGSTLGLSYLIFLPAIILASVLVNHGSGFLATALSALLEAVFFIEPDYTSPSPTRTPTSA